MPSNGAQRLLMHACVHRGCSKVEGNPCGMGISYRRFLSVSWPSPGRFLRLLSPGCPCNSSLKKTQDFKRQKAELYQSSRLPLMLQICRMMQGAGALLCAQVGKISCPRIKSPLVPRGIGKICKKERAKETTCSALKQRKQKRVFA